MKGQKLFVRPMEPGDAGAVQEFLTRESPRTAPPVTALIGKLVGEIVAVLSIAFTDEQAEIHGLVVARDLRKKRIGRFMIDELSALAAKMDRRSLVMRCEAPAGFLRSTGFVAVGETMVRKVVR